MSVWENERTCWTNSDNTGRIEVCSQLTGQYFDNIHFPQQIDYLHETWLQGASQSANSGYSQPDLIGIPPFEEFPYEKAAPPTHTILQLPIFLGTQKALSLPLSQPFHCELGYKKSKEAKDGYNKTVEKRMGLDEPDELKSTLCC